MAHNCLCRLQQDEPDSVNKCRTPRGVLWGEIHAGALVALLAHLVLPQQVSAQTPGGTPTCDLEQAIALLAEARHRFQAVQDYQCRLLKHERVNGTLLPACTMTMKVRNRPFSVYLRCESPVAERGLEICFVEGRNQGKMRVHSAGALGIVGFVSVDPSDPRAFERNRHCITEAGLGNLLDSTARHWEMERRLNQTHVFITASELEGRACTRIETIHPDRRAGSFYGYRCLLWLDQATHLPAGAETYDWPRPGGPPEGDLLESYRFLDLRYNTGLSDDTFAH